MSHDRKHLGELFATRRKEMNVSLKEVEGAISIRSTYLQAIEEGQIGKLISPVHAQGFVKQYAQFLGFDADRLIKEYSQTLHMPGMRQEFSYGIGTMEARGAQSGGVKWLPNLLWILLSVVVMLAAWFFAKFLDLF